MSAYTYRGDKATRRAYLIEPGWPEPPPEHDPAPATEPLTFAQSGSAYGPTPLHPSADPEAWSRYPGLPHGCGHDGAYATHPSEPADGAERHASCRPCYNPDDLTDLDAIRARVADIHAAGPSGGWVDVEPAP